MFNTEKGFGFVRPDDDGPEVFAHISACVAGGIPEPRVGLRIAFNIGERKGRPVAVNLSRAA